jgi:hypothetical protein
MKKLLSALVLVLLCASCNGGGGSQATDDGDNGPNADATPALATPRGVKAAKKGTVNVPKEGTYLYDYESERTSATTPNATPQRTDAELSSKVTVSRDVVTVEDKTSENPAVATVQRRFADDGVYELSFRTKFPQGTSSCTFDEPTKVLPIPLKDAKMPDQSLAGDGSSCNGERDVTVEGPQSIKDADGVTWTTWRIEMTTTVKSPTGITSRNTLKTWFSPDLGKEIRAQSVAENLTADGQVAARGESTQLLKSYPT